MKLHYSLLGLALLSASCCKECGNSAGSGNTATLEAGSSNFAVNKHLSRSLKYVDTDGEFLTLSDGRGEMALTLEALTELEKLARTDEEFDMPEAVHFTDIFTKTRLDQFHTTCSSCKFEKGAWTNKLFFDLNGTNDGVLSLFKGRGGQWGVYDYAPSGSDYVMEVDVNVESLNALMSQYVGLLAGDEKAKAEAGIEQMKQEMGEFSFVLDGIHPRMSMVLKLNHDAGIETPVGIEVPDANFVYRLEGLGKAFALLEKFLETAPPNKVNIKKVGKLTYYTMSEALPVPGKDVEGVQPVLLVDEENETVWLASRKSFLDECLGGGAKLKDDASFKTVMGELSDSGSMFSYVSKDVVKLCQEMVNGEAGKMLKQQAKNEASSPEDEKAVDAVFDKLLVRVVDYLAGAEGGFASTVDLNEDGLLISSRSPLAMKGGSSMEAVAVTASLAAISSPIIIRQIARARATQAINNSKDIYVGMRDYVIQKGTSLPGTQGDGKSANEHFRVFFKEGYIVDESPFYVKGVQDAIEGDGDITEGNILETSSNVFGYVPGINIMTAEANHPLLISPLKKEYGEVVIDTAAYGNQVVILTADGAAMALPLNDEGDIEDPDFSFKNGVLSYKSYKTGKMVKLKVALPEYAE